MAGKEGMPKRLRLSKDSGILRRLLGNLIVLDLREVFSIESNTITFSITFLIASKSLTKVDEVIFRTTPQGFGCSLARGF